MPRNYKKEYANYHAKPAQKKRRAARNAARRKAMREGRAKKGDGMDVHHVKPFAKGGGVKSATRVVPKSKNRSFARTRTARMK